MDTPATTCSTSTREYSHGLPPQCRLTQTVAAYSTLMVVIKCEAKSCLMVNPHLSGAASANTVYGSNSVMEMVVPGDEMSFFSWLTEDFETSRIGTESLTVTSTPPSPTLPRYRDRLASSRAGFAFAPSAPLLELPTAPLRQLSLDARPTAKTETPRSRPT